MKMMSPSRAHGCGLAGNRINPDNAGFYRLARLQGCGLPDPVQPAKKFDIDFVATGNLVERIAFPDFIRPECGSWSDLALRVLLLHNRLSILQKKLNPIRCSMARVRAAEKPS